MTGIIRGSPVVGARLADLRGRMLTLALHMRRRTGFGAEAGDRVQDPLPLEVGRSWVLAVEGLADALAEIVAAPPVSPVEVREAARLDDLEGQLSALRAEVDRLKVRNARTAEGLAYAEAALQGHRERLEEAARRLHALEARGEGGL